MHFPRVIFIVCCIASTVSYADSNLPPILNSYPKCDYQLIEQATASDKAIVLEENIEKNKQGLLQKAILKLRQQAAATGADAVILTDVQGVMGNSQSLRTLRYSGYEVRYSIAGELISLCQDDPSLATVLTPFNSSGVRQAKTQQHTVATSMQFEFSIPATTQQATEKQPPLARTISLEQGFYGAEPGMTTQQVQTLFGMPTAELALKNDYLAWVYGQEHLVIFVNDTAVAFRQSNAILSAEIKKRLAENLHFQQHNWQLDNRFGRRSALDDIKAFYQDRLIALDQYRFALQNENSQLILEFSPFLNMNKNDNQLQLVNISLISQQFDASRLQLKLPAADSLQPLKSSLLTFATSAAQSHFVMPDIAIFNRSQLRDGNVLTVLGPALALSFDKSQIKGLTITNIISDYVISDIQSQLQLLALPANRDAFMARFPDAFDSLNKLTLYGDNIEIKATYNNDDLIDSMYISWY